MYKFYRGSFLWEDVIRDQFIVKLKRYPKVLLTTYFNLFNIVLIFTEGMVNRHEWTDSTAVITRTDRKAGLKKNIEIDLSKFGSHLQLET